MTKYILRNRYKNIRTYVGYFEGSATSNIDDAKIFISENDAIKFGCTFSGKWQVIAVNVSIIVNENKLK